MDSFKYSYKMKKENTTLVNVYNSGYQKCTSGYHMGPLTRDRYLIHHVVSGKGYYVVGSQTFELKNGDTFLIYPNTIVSYYADELDPWEYYWVGFDGADIKFLIRRTDFTRTCPVITTGHGEELKQMLYKIYQSSGAELYKHVQMVGHLYLFLSKLVELSQTNHETVDLSLEYTKQAIEYIHEHYAKPITVADIATHVGISRSHLYRVFMKNVDESPQSYLEKYRISQSQMLLEQTSLSIGQIAQSVGYEDPLHFSKVFKKIHQISPKNYKKRSVAQTS